MSIAIPIVAGIALVLVATAPGVGLSSDSVLYITAARELAAGHGLMLPWGWAEPKPLVTTPPLFPAGLALLDRIGVPPVIGARWLNACALGVSLWLFGWIVRRGSGSLALALCGMGLLATSRVMLDIHSMAWSEPLFLTLGLAGLLLVAVFLDSSWAPSLLIGCIVLGLAWLQRYAGAALVLAGGASLLLGPGPWRRRLAGAVGVTVLATLPVAAWMVRNMLLSGDVSARPLGWHPALMACIRPASHTIAGWILLGGSLGEYGDIALVTLVAAVAAGAVVRGRVRMPNEPTGLTRQRTSILWVFGLFAAVYPLFSIAARSIYDRSIPFDDRICSPLLVSGLLLALLVGYGLWQRGGCRPAVARVALLACCVLIAVRLGLVLRRSVELGRVGQGYQHARWRESATMEAVGALPERLRLYSNAPDAIYILTGRLAQWLPHKSVVTAHAQRPGSAALEALRQQLREGALVVSFEQLGRSRASWMPRGAQLENCLPLRAVVRTSDGAIYGAVDGDG